MVSEAKLAANRRNAKLSTGPRTPEGKARSARNATIHNFRSRHLQPTTAEDHEAIASLVDLFSPEANPSTPEERAIVVEFATAHYLRNKLEAINDRFICTNEANYLYRHLTAADTRFYRAFRSFNTLPGKRIGNCTNEPTVRPAAPRAA